MTPQRLAETVDDAVRAALAASARSPGVGPPAGGSPAHLRRDTTPGARPGSWRSFAVLACGESPDRTAGLADQVGAALARRPEFVSVHVSGAGSLELIVRDDLVGAGVVDRARTPPLEAGQHTLTRPLEAGQHPSRPLVADPSARLVAGIGAGAARYVAARGGSRVGVDVGVAVDSDAWRRRTPDNPLFVVLHAHARAHTRARLAARVGIDRGETFDPWRLAGAEHDLLAHLDDGPGARRRAERRGEAGLLVRHLERLAAAAHRAFDAGDVRPVGGARATPTHSARLWLGDAARHALADTLALLGVPAPSRI